MSGAESLQRPAEIQSHAPGEKPDPLYVAHRVGLLLIPDLPRFLGGRLVYRPAGRPPAGTTAVIGWGLKGVSLHAKAYAEHQELPYLALEDGFLRSVSLSNVDAPLSIVIDDLGIYYDAQSPSRLENFIAAGYSGTQQARARALMDAWKVGRISKYNFAREQPPPVNRPYVLAVDQTVGDASIQYGLASADSFKCMLEAALDENPGLPVVLKIHPDMISGRKRAHFDKLTAGQASRVKVLAANAHPPGLIEHAQRTYVVTSQIGFEALIWGVPVRTFGMPFYAGWGLTQDDLDPPKRRLTAHRVVLEDLAHAALVTYPRYLDPETRQLCEAERVVDWMALQRRMRERFPAQINALSFSNWKKPVARAFFAGSELKFLQPTDQPPVETTLAVWGQRETSRHLRSKDDEIVSVAGENIIRVEDGFLRSVGLGADWVSPLSWVMDCTGMYYDAFAPSDLETILQTTVFDDVLIARARALRTTIVTAGITKYNVGAGSWQKPANGKSVVLVPGQVEADASIIYGAPGIRRNLELLEAARHARPQAHIVYKPHPDVVSGKRGLNQDEARTTDYCDEIVTDVPIHTILAAVDEIHVLTSLTGFEALLRGKRVVCYGSPFYAGWGLTNDEHPYPRRTRRLTLDELVAGTLILYPTYVSRVTGAFTTPERALHELQHWHDIEPPRDAVWLRLLRVVRQLRNRWRKL